MFAAAPGSWQLYGIIIGSLISTLVLLGMVARSKPGRAVGRRLIAAPYWEAHAKHTTTVTAPEFASLRAENTVQHEQGAVRMRLIETTLSRKIDETRAEVAAYSERDTRQHDEMNAAIAALATRQQTTTVTVKQENQP
jgi:hypothetical protein